MDGISASDVNSIIDIVVMHMWLFYSIFVGVFVHTPNNILYRCMCIVFIYRDDMDSLFQDSV